MHVLLQEATNITMYVAARLSRASRYLQQLLGFNCQPVDRILAEMGNDSTTNLLFSIVVVFTSFKLAKSDWLIYSVDTYHGNSTAGLHQIALKCTFFVCSTITGFCFVCSTTTEFRFVCSTTTEALRKFRSFDFEKCI